MNRCVHGVIGICVACTIATALFHIQHEDRNDHDHSDVAPIEYVGPSTYVVQPTTAPVFPQPINVGLARRDPRFTAALSTALGSPRVLLSPTT
jgi:hypothetical protein